MKKPKHQPVIAESEPTMSLPILSPGQSFFGTIEAQTIDEASAYIYRYYLDLSSTGVIIPNVQVLGDPPSFQWSFLPPLFPAGNHRLEMTVENGIGESPRSLPFDFTVGSVPKAPVILGIR